MTDEGTVTGVAWEVACTTWEAGQVRHKSTRSLRSAGYVCDFPGRCTLLTCTTFSQKLDLLCTRIFHEKVTQICGEDMMWTHDLECLASWS